MGGGGGWSSGGGGGGGGWEESHKLCISTMHFHPNEWSVGGEYSSICTVVRESILAVDTSMNGLLHGEYAHAVYTNVNGVYRHFKVLRHFTHISQSATCQSALTVSAAAFPNWRRTIWRGCLLLLRFLIMETAGCPRPDLRLLAAEVHPLYCFYSCDQMGPTEYSLMLCL